MKKILFIYILTFFSVCSWAQTDSTAILGTQADNNVAEVNKLDGDKVLTQSSEAQLFNEANEAFIAGQYPLAVANYEAILNKGVHSDKVYYNLGNAYFQQGQIGKAILNFTRAKNLNPNDDDINYNLELAIAKTKDKIDVVPKFFIARWIDSLGEMTNSNGWTVVSIIMFVIACGGVLIWLISNNLVFRKLGFFTGLIGMLFCVSAIAYAVDAATVEYDNEQAVIINSAAPVKSAPSVGAKDLFILHEGTIVKVIQELDGYSEVQLSDGNKGWILSDAIEGV